MHEYIIGQRVRKLVAEGEFKLAFAVTKGFLKGIALNRKHEKLERSIELHNATIVGLDSVVDKVLSK